MGAWTAARRFAAIALTPLALTVLLSEPAGGAQPGAREAVVAEGAHPSQEMGETAESGHEQSEEHIANPLQNFAHLHYGLNAEGGPWQKGEHKMPPPFLAVLFNFAAFVWLIARFAGPSIKRMTFERHDRIANALAESAKLRDEARARLASYEGKLAGLQAEIDALVAGIRSEAEAEKARIIAEAQARAERMQREAEQQIGVEMARVRMTLEREAVEAAVRIAEKLLREKTTDADQRVLADKFLQGLQTAAARRRTVPR